MDFCYVHLDLYSLIHHKSEYGGPSNFFDTF